MKHFLSLKKGFTLLELLVAIAILGTVSALLLPNFINARQRGRDSQRKSDLRSIRSALELYKQDHTPPSYPAALPAANNPWANGTTIYMSNFPGDPSGGSYNYSVGPFVAPYTTYTLCAVLENNADSQGQTCAAPCPVDATKKCYSVTEQ